MPTRQILLKDFLAANGYTGVTTGGEPGTPAVDNGTFEQFMGGKTAQERFPQWAAGGEAAGGYSLSPDGQYLNVPEQYLSENMNSGGAFDWGDMIGPGLLLAGPFAGMMGAFGAAGAAGAAGAGGAMDMGVGLQGWMNSLNVAAGAAGAGATGGGMDWFEQLLQGFDPGSENLFNFEGGGVPGGAPTGGGWDYNEFLKSVGVDPSSTQFSGGTLSNTDIMSQIMGGGSSLPSGVKDLVSQLAKSGASPGSISSLLKGLGIDLGGFGGLLDSGLNLAARSGPGLMALKYANEQPGIDTSSLEGLLRQAGQQNPATSLFGDLYNKAGQNPGGSLFGDLYNRSAANSQAFVNASIAPMQQNIAAGYGDLLKSQAQRGIRGSSFGDTDISNYMSTTGDALSRAGTNAYQASLTQQGGFASALQDSINKSLTSQGAFAGQLGNLTNQGITLQSDLATKIEALKAQAQQNKNNIYGKAFDVLGRGINPGGFGSSLTLAGP